MNLSAFPHFQTLTVLTNVRHSKDKSGRQAQIYPLSQHKNNSKTKKLMLTFSASYIFSASVPSLSYSVTIKKRI